MQNYRTNHWELSCFFCGNLQFKCYFDVKTSMFKLRPLLLFLCLINSFYRRHVPSMYNTSMTRFNKLTFFRLPSWSAEVIGHCQMVLQDNLLFTERGGTIYCDYYCNMLFPSVSLLSAGLLFTGHCRIDPTHSKFIFSLLLG